ncbi:MAG: 4-alpha-glucanotransferase [Bifidobacteriaceae bacterium]|jgi:4-alpha-glucanotransferase|nr:4-alpha-glucanotransferase [Bifidobacteriaceae bacterium]
MSQTSSSRARFLDVLRGASSAPTIELTELARKYGVTTEYVNWKGESTRVSAKTVKAVLTALGAKVDTAEDVQRSLEGFDDRSWRELIAPSTVVRAGAQNWAPVTIPAGARARLWIELDDDPVLAAQTGRASAAGLDGTGGRVELGAVKGDQGDRRRIDGQEVIRAYVELPNDLPLGWHRLRVQVEGGRVAEGVLVVCPDRLELPAKLREQSVWGPMVQLYATRSRDSWGTGDFEDLATLGHELAQRDGADFVLINPIHAGEPVGPFTQSPYLPTTRDFTNPYYIRPEAIEEYASAPAGARAAVDALAAQAKAADADADHLDRDVSWAIKADALRILYQVPRSPARQADLDEYRADRQPGIGDFALWSALKAAGLADQVDYGSVEAAGFAAEQADEVDYYIWLQWIADQQLARAQERCKQGGMALGIVKDLAVGVHSEGADAWSRRRVLAAGIQVGAPPDYFNQIGQGWSEPPWRPDALAATGYAAYRSMLRAVLAHAGALRVDHILGLTRLWWIPQGMGPGDGTYVAYDREAMVSILILEARRAGAVVVGEDLGVVPPGLREYLGARGLLGNSIVWFEKTPDGADLLDPQAYRRLALTAITTHDLPPTSAYLAGEHVAERDRLGLLDVPLEEARAAARAERALMVAKLVSRGLLAADQSDDELAIVKAMHRFLQITPSVMLGVSLADLVGERRTQNLPGTDREYPNWSVPLADAAGRPVFIEDLEDNPCFQAIASVMRPDAADPGTGTGTGTGAGAGAEAGAGAGAGAGAADEG